MTAADREKQLAQAEEVLADRLPGLGFAKGLYFGRYFGAKFAPLPPAAGRSADQPRRRRPGGLLPARDRSGRHRSQRAKFPIRSSAGWAGWACSELACRRVRRRRLQPNRVLPDDRGARRALREHGAVRQRAPFDRAAGAGPVRHAEQQARWLPKLSQRRMAQRLCPDRARGRQRRRQRADDGHPHARWQRLLLNGEKRWITNGGICPGADRHGPHARCRAARSPRSRPSSSRPTCRASRWWKSGCPKCGVRGTATSRLAFHDMFVPSENMLGQLGKGLKVALTVLDFGRTTFGAVAPAPPISASQRAVRPRPHATCSSSSRWRFELVKEKIAYMAAGVFAMESATYQTAALIDSGTEDYMLETAMLKVFATDVLWRIINDTIQIFGGKAYFTDEPYERMMRDARINMIGEGANDVLRAFIALVGMRDVGLELKGVLEAAQASLEKPGQTQQLCRPPDRGPVCRPADRRPPSALDRRRRPAGQTGGAFRRAGRAAAANPSGGNPGPRVPAGTHRRRRPPNSTPARACCGGSTNCYPITIGRQVKSRRIWPPAGIICARPSASALARRPLVE